MNARWEIRAISMTLKQQNWSTSVTCELRTG